ncbi:hypothetical protein WJX72_006042 [[Myrmecia] bisecta]|uniref:Uncharacterized protein n=1 Tax=[Myrmecia] bisecta TaxID=41462 RepID=A0AAW1QF73_9CHLO
MKLSDALQETASDLYFSCGGLRSSVPPLPQKMPDDMLRNLPAGVCGQTALAIALGVHYGQPAFGPAWLNLIKDNLDSYCPVIRTCQEAGDMTSVYKCVEGLFAMSKEKGFYDALDGCTVAGQARAPGLVTLLAELIVRAAASAPTTNDAVPSLSFCAMVTLHTLVRNKDELAGLADDEDTDINEDCNSQGSGGDDKCGIGGDAVMSMFHRPTLEVLLRGDPARLAEALMRTTTRWHRIWDNGQFPGHMMTQMLMTDLASVSMLATFRKAALVSVTPNLSDSSFLAVTLAEAFESLLGPGAASAAVDAPGAQQDAHQALRLPVYPCNTRPDWQAVHGYAAAWMLPAVTACIRNQPGHLGVWLGALASLTARLAKAAALGAGSARHLFLELSAVVTERLVRGQASGPAMFAQQARSSEALRVLRIVNEIIDMPLPPGCDSQAKLKLLVHPGLLRALCQLAARWWTDEDRPAVFFFLAQLILPQTWALVPHHTPGPELRQASTRDEKLARMWSAETSLDHRPMPKAERGRKLIIAMSRDLEDQRDGALADMTALVEVLEAQCGPLDQAEADAELERVRMAALGTGCNNPQCKPSKARVKLICR